MKTISCLLLILFINIRISAQIPNSGFEDWLPNQACLRPAGWHTVYSEIDSSGTYCPVQRSEDHFPLNQGEYSIRIANDTALWNSGTQPASWLGWGIVFSSRLNDRPLFPVQGRPKSLTGYYRFLPANGDTMNLRAFLYYNGTEISSAHFQSSTPAPDWIFFRVIFDDTTYSSVDSGRITLSAANEPKDGSTGPRGNSVLFVDNIAFEYSLTSVFPSLFPKERFDIRLSFANKEVLLERTLKATLRTATLRLSDLNGRVVYQSLWESGMSVLQLENHLFSGIRLLDYRDGTEQFRNLVYPRAIRP